MSHDDNLRSGFTSAVDFEYHNQRDSSFHNECSLPTADHKSQSLTRQKRGLKSLFHSFKHHRNHRNVGSEKTEMIALSSPQCKNEVPVVRDNAIQYVTECLGSEPDVPDLANAECDYSVGPECNGADLEAEEKSVEHESPKSELDVQICEDQMEEINLMAVISSEFKESSRGHSEPCLILQMMSDAALKSETPAGSSDQLNLIYGEVASLKSFDSLTGCGDIIADQEDDSITESTVSGERSRNGGKRASCYLTYQGGGEEMASPADFDEQCLGDFWGNNASEETCCTCDQEHPDLTAKLSSSHNMDLMNSSSAQQASGMDTSSIADVFTPPSEHQESVPNSDEGYYDSTTPGPEEGQDKTDRLRPDRLPRDSYSGDALYELFAPDESLISPHYENKSKVPSSKPSEYANKTVDVTDSAFVPDMSRLQISPELYKVEDFLEVPRTCSNPSELNTVDLQEMDWKTNCNLNPKPQASVNKNIIERDGFEEKGNMLASTKSLNVECEQRHSNISFESDPDFEQFSEPKEQHLEENKPVALPYRNINAQSPDCTSGLDDGQTVCFSQALVDYTKNSQMLSNLHNSVDGLETNMQALPTIVTFDVVDMHNEGEYDEQIHMELEEDISSPYQEFEESYLQKDAFAECDYQMLDLYEQSLISNTWAIASLPRHLGLTRLSQSMPNPLSVDRRSRSLDTEGLELKTPDAYRENRAAIVSGPQKEQDSERDSSPCYKKNVLLSASELRDSGSIMALSWQTRSEMALSLPLTDGEVTEKSHNKMQLKHNIFSNSPGRGFPNTKSPHICSDVSDRVSRDLISQDTELYFPLQSDSCLPRSTFVYSGMTGEEASHDVSEDIVCKAATGLQSYSPFGQSRQVGSREGGVPHAGSAGVPKDEPPRDVACPAACNKLPKTTFN
ncbi:APC membrane recruitment protein 1-like [Aulostomus maculatus]